MITKRNRLIQWRNRQIEHAKIEGLPFFLDLPDAWYNPPTWGCKNGHVSVRYLRCEEDGNVCLECLCPVYLIPRIKEEELIRIVSGASDTDMGNPITTLERKHSPGAI